jgi:hypothetical protein
MIILRLQTCAASPRSHEAWLKPVIGRTGARLVGVLSA